jgi:hypothetical protein
LRRHRTKLLSAGHPPKLAWHANVRNRDPQAKPL